MLNRLTVSALLKAVILATALVVIAGFSLRAWDSFNQLQSANRIVRVANASADVFKAMNNLRADRSTSALTAWDSSRRPCGSLPARSVPAARRG